MKITCRSLGRFIFLPVLGMIMAAGAGAQTYSPPSSPRTTWNFNPGWKFLKGDVAGAEAPAFDDTKWESVSTPHTYNDVDSFDEIITRGGEGHHYMGKAWYRKHFKLPAAAAGSKVFLEFEGIRQAARFFINGKPIGKFENGVTACGVDITANAKFGGEENVLAVLVDNSNDYVEEATRTAYEWMSRDFNPNYGGLTRNVWLHLMGKVYQTLPLYENLGTTGVYVHATNIVTGERTAEVSVEAQVRNESGESQSVELTAVVVDAAGVARATFKGDTYDMVGGETQVLNATGKLAQANFWDDRQPNLYTVFTILTINGKVADVDRVTTGFRKAEFRGGAGTGGLFLNDRFVYLKGYAQRTTDEWAGLGSAYPDWMRDYNLQLMRDSHANYIRWMHIAPQRANVSACDKFGIIEIAPAGDKEKDVTGRQWEQRLEVMRDTMIYYRNHPSILFWEAGNSGISGEHMKQMRDLRVQWDPAGGRAIGCRTLEDPASVPNAEYFGIMIGMDDRVQQLTNYTQTFRAYSAERRDKAPMIETEDFRDEAARRFWDDFSPPHFGFKPKTNDTWKWNSETFCIAAIIRYHEYWAERIANPDPKHAKWSGYASIIFADSNSHGRQYDSEVCRVSGKLDAVRLPKEAYYVYRVMQNEQPDLHIIGHWTYPANTKKTIHVAANCQSVELFLNGKSKGVLKQAADGYLFSFENIAFEPGSLKAVGTSDGKVVCQQELRTAGEAKQLKLTPHTGPDGLRADGSDVAFVDVEVTDANGERCPTDEARVDFEIAGPAVWRGGYNSGKVGSVNNKYLDTECGINRVSVRSTQTAGTIVLTAKRAGLTPATITIKSQPVKIADGLMAEWPQTLPGPLKRE